MKALVLHGPGDLTYEEDWAEPELKEGWALMRITYCGICGSDLPRTMQTGAHKHPLICGHEFSGVIEKPAPSSNRFKGGERVAVFPLIPCGECPACENEEYFHCKSYDFLGSRSHGAFAEYCIAPEENLFILPDNADDRAGAFVEPLGVTRHMIRQSGFKEGENALIMGAGSLGILAALWLQSMGASRVVLAGRSEESQETARKAGVKNVVSIKSKEFAEVEGFDHGYECAGANQALLELLRKVRKKGSVTVVGRDTKDLKLPLKDFEGFMRKEMVLRGCWGYDARGDGEEIRKALEEGKIDVLPLITREIDLSEGIKTLQNLYNKTEYNCKVLFKID